MYHSVVGAAIIICGLYSVLWGKSKEVKKITRLVPTKSFTEEPMDRVEENAATESFKGLNNHGGNVIVAVAPNFIPGSKILEVFDEEEEQDLEAKVMPNHEIKPSI